MYKTDYHDKINQILSNKTYKKISKDPTQKLERKVKQLIKSSSIPSEQHWKVLPSASKPPRFYGLPKIHKPGAPLRPIVSNIGSPTYKLAKHLASHIQPFIGSGPSYIKNSSHFVNLIQDLTLAETDLLVSFDVVSLFTNVPVDESIE